ncbi:MAG: carboxymuconolactone decarboxylase family protein [Bacteroidota bacterium]
MEFTIFNPENAPEGSKALLENSQKAYRMVPNLHGVLAESPQLLEAYKVLGSLFSKSSLSAEERHVVWMSINVDNQCHYCVPAHTAIAKMDKVDDDILNAIRKEEPIPNPRLEALKTFTLKLKHQQGRVSDEDLQTFLDAGFTKANVFDVLLGLAHKTISNYTNHFANTPVDAPFQAFAWEAKTV